MAKAGKVQHVPSPKRRCAVYTRVCIDHGSRAGEFNSLGNQREQAHTSLQPLRKRIRNDFAHADARSERREAQLVALVDHGLYVSATDLGPSSGFAPSQEEAMADFAKRWRIWLDWAGLREIAPEERVRLP
jgi:hypothetical protein